jgi:hypothetical protein
MTEAAGFPEKSTCLWHENSGRPFTDDSNINGVKVISTYFASYVCSPATDGLSTQYDPSLTRTYVTSSFWKG